MWKCLVAQVHLMLTNTFNGNLGVSLQQQVHGHFFIFHESVCPDSAGMCATSFWNVGLSLIVKILRNCVKSLLQSIVVNPYATKFLFSPVGSPVTCPTKPAGIHKSFNKHWPNIEFLFPVVRQSTTYLGKNMGRKIFDMDSCLNKDAIVTDNVFKVCPTGSVRPANKFVTIFHGTCRRTKRQCAKVPLRTFNDITFLCSAQRPAAKIMMLLKESTPYFRVITIPVRYRCHGDIVNVCKVAA